MKPVSDRSYQPVSWPHDNLQSRKDKKGDQQKVHADQPKETDPAEKPSASSKKVPLSIYDRNGVMSSDDPNAGQNIDLKA